MKNEGWEKLFYQYIEDSRALSFSWGEHDCALWAAGFVDLATGSSLTEQWAGFYDTEEGADALLHERGFADLEALADSLGTPVPIKKAQRGDIVLHASGALGICGGRRSHFLTVDNGLVAVMTLTCIKAWSI